MSFGGNGSHRTRRAVAYAIAALAAVAAVVCVPRTIPKSEMAVEKACRKLAYRLHSRHGLAFLVELDCAHPVDAACEIVSAQAVAVNDAPRAAVHGGAGRRIMARETSYVSPPNACMLKSADTATYALRIAPDDASRRQELANAGYAASGMSLFLEGGRVVASLRHDGEERILSAPFAGAPGKFAHVALSISPTSAALYQDGVEEARVDLPWSIKMTSRPWGFSAASRYPFLGVVGSLAIWDRALDGKEIARVAATRGSVAGLYEPLAALRVRAARLRAGFVRDFSRIFDRLSPFSGGGAILRAQCPTLTLRMKNADERHFNSAHEKSLHNGYRTAAAADMRKIGVVFDGRKFNARAGLDDQYSFAAPSKRPAFVVACDIPELFGEHGVARIYPPELHLLFHADAPDLFPANGRYVRLYEGTSFRGIYIVEPLDSPGSAWLERGDYTTIALHAGGDPKVADIAPRPCDAEESRRMAAALVRSDILFPWSSGEIRARRKALDRRRQDLQIHGRENPVAPVWSILGKNRSPFFVTENLALDAKGLVWSSSEPDTIAEDGRVTRPDDGDPKIVELSATDVFTGARQRYRLRVMPRRRALPAIFLGVGSPIQKSRRCDFVCSFVGADGDGAIALRGLVGNGCGIRHRGNTSYVKGVKRSLSVEFEEPLAWPNPGRPARHLLLQNGYSDPTRLRNRISFDFYHDAAAAVSGGDLPAPRFDWAEVFFNGEYLGVWEACGRVRDDVPESNSIFKIRGVNTWLWSRSDTSILDCITASPGDAAAYDPMEELFSFTATALGRDFTMGLPARLDMDNLVASFLLLNFTDNHDAKFMNQYFAFDPETGRTLLIPWDYDKTFLSPRRVRLSNHLFNRLVRECPEFLQKARETWRALRAGAYADDALLSRIDGYAALLAPCMDEEWRLLKPAGFDGDFAAAVEDLKKFVLMRLDFMDGMFR